MNLERLNTIIFMLLIFVPTLSRAQGLWQDVVSTLEVAPTANSEIAICPDHPAQIRDLNEEALWSLAESKKGFDQCGSIEAYQSLMTHFPGGTHSGEASLALVQIYLDTGNTIRAMDLANSVLSAGTANSEAMHVLLFRAWSMKIKSLEQGNESITEYLEFSLAPLDEITSINNIKYQTFIDTYPHSAYLPEVVLMMNEARQTYGNALLAEAKKLEVEMNYPAVIEKLSALLSLGSASAIYAEGAFEMAKVNADFAFLIKYKTLLPDAQLNQLLERDTMVPLEQAEREQLSKSTLDQAHHDVLEMKEKISDSEWTKKAEIYVDSLQL